MFGGSYGGWTQWSAAREGPPHLRTMASAAAGGQWVRDFPFDSGMLSLHTLGWLHLTAGRTMKDTSAVAWEAVLHHLPVRTMDEALGRQLRTWHEYLDHPVLDDYWAALTLTEADFAGIDVPGLHITGWYDGDQRGALAFYAGMVAHSPAAASQELRIGPWGHGGTRVPKQSMDGVDFTPAAVVDMVDLHIRWFSRWLAAYPPPATPTS
jgi:putative CocE/NonD family hydrolase